MAFPFWNFEIEHIVPRVQGRLGLRRQPAATLRGMQPGQGDRNAGRADREAQGTGATGRMVRRDGAKHVDFFKLNKALEEGIGIESACRPNDRRNPARTPSARPQRASHALKRSFMSSMSSLHHRRSFCRVWRTCAGPRQQRWLTGTTEAATTCTLVRCPSPGTAVRRGQQFRRRPAPHRCRWRWRDRQPPIPAPAPARL